MIMPTNNMNSWIRESVIWRKRGSSIRSSRINLSKIRKRAIKKLNFWSKLYQGLSFRWSSQTSKGKC